MELREALTQISEIRRQVARTEVFRGYRAVPVAFSGGLALLTACLQSVWVVQPGEENVAGWLSLWVGACIASLVATGVEMVLHCRHSSSPLTQETTLLAVGQFMPSVVVGGLLIPVLLFCAPQSLWMLPGLWALLFSMGIFASYRLLPRQTFWVGAFYMFAGLMLLALAQGPDGFSPWAMGLPFGIGQLFAAAVLYWTLERRDG